MKKCKEQSSKKRYAYLLPQDEMRLAIDAIVFAGIDAIQDGICDKSKEEIEKRAYALCEQFKIATNSEYSTNDIDQFHQIFIGNYTNMYLEKQKVYRKDRTAHAQEIELAKKADFIVRYRIFVEKSVAQGGNG